MKKSDLKLIIRKLVREEVAMAIQEVISEIKQPSQQTQPKTEKKIVKKKDFTNNSVLNDVLNETAVGGDWKTMGGEHFTTERMNDIVGGNYAEMMNNTGRANIPANPDAMITSMGENPKGVSDIVKDNIFNKDYSSLIQAMDKKAKQTRGQ